LQPKPNKIMDLKKGSNRKSKQHLIAVNEKTHEKLRHLCYLNKVTRGEVIRRAVDLYEKASIFDLVK